MKLDGCTGYWDVIDLYSSERTLQSHNISKIVTNVDNSPDPDGDPLFKPHILQPSGIPLPLNNTPFKPKTFDFNPEAFKADLDSVPLHKKNQNISMSSLSQKTSDFLFRIKNSNKIPKPQLFKKIIHPKPSHDFIPFNIPSSQDTFKNEPIKRLNSSNCVLKNQESNPLLSNTTSIPKDEERAESVDIFSIKIDTPLQLGSPIPINSINLERTIFSSSEKNITSENIAFKDLDAKYSPNLLLNKNLIQLGIYPRTTSKKTFHSKLRKPTPLSYKNKLGSCTDPNLPFFSFTIDPSGDLDSNRLNCDYSIRQMDVNKMVRMYYTDLFPNEVPSPDDQVPNSTPEDNPEPIDETNSDYLVGNSLHISYTESDDNPNNLDVLSEKDTIEAIIQSSEEGDVNINASSNISTDTTNTGKTTITEPQDHINLKDNLDEDDLEYTSNILLSHKTEIIKSEINDIPVQQPNPTENNIPEKEQAEPITEDSSQIINLLPSPQNDPKTPNISHSAGLSQSINVHDRMSGLSTFRKNNIDTFLKSPRIESIVSDENGDLAKDYVKYILGNKSRENVSKFPERRSSNSYALMQKNYSAFPPPLPLEKPIKPLTELEAMFNFDFKPISNNSNSNSNVIVLQKRAASQEVLTTRQFEDSPLKSRPISIDSSLPMDSVATQTNLNSNLKSEMTLSLRNVDIDLGFLKSEFKSNKNSVKRTSKNNKTQKGGASHLVLTELLDFSSKNEAPRSQLTSVKKPKAFESYQKLRVLRKKSVSRRSRIGSLKKNCVRSDSIKAVKAATKSRTRKVVHTSSKPAPYKGLKFKLNLDPILPEVPRFENNSSIVLKKNKARLVKKQSVKARIPLKNMI
ncbi:hypothetical protein BB560_006883 [Smittium megazygosporum]|uniref:Uncharacterized protein n=1 Tax=Smittium megazygosporum TaxID=133381 RepID=A0A2T9Y0J9_9FUNG|nr:hypothetical protein BB560_006883 [Smittium megazygosporum]